MFRRAVAAHRRDHLRDRRRLLPNGGIDGNHAGRALVDDGIDGDCRLAGAAVADDQFPLAATERDHGIDDKKPGRQRARHQRSVDDRRRRLLDRGKRRCGNRSAAIERRPERIDDAPKQGIADRHSGHLAGAVDDAAGGNSGAAAEQHAADRLFPEIDGETAHPASEDEELVKPGIG